MKPTSNAMDMMNQKAGFAGSRPTGTYFMARVITGTMPAIRQFMDSNSGKNVLVSERR